MYKLLIVDPKNISSGGRISPLKSAKEYPYIDLQNAMFGTVKQLCSTVNKVFGITGTQLQLVLTYKGYSIPHVLQITHLSLDTVMVHQLISACKDNSSFFKIVSGTNNWYFSANRLKPFSSLNILKTDETDNVTLVYDYIARSNKYKGLPITEDKILAAPPANITIEEYYQYTLGLTPLTTKLSDCIVDGDTLKIELQFIEEIFETEDSYEFGMIKELYSKFGYNEFDAELVESISDLIGKFGGVPYTNDKGELQLFNGVDNM